MKRIRKQATLAVFVLSLALILTASLVMLVQAAVPWTKQGEVSLEGELYVEEASVIKDGATYKMWYTHGKTDLTISDIASSLAAILTDEIVTDLTNLDIDGLLDDISLLDVDALDALYDLLTDTATVIGYATSSDGITWTVQNSEVFAGSTGGAFNSIGAPSVIKTGGSYQMWYSHTATNLTRTALGNILADMGGTTAEREAALLALADATSTVIGYTTSADGVTWAAPDLGVLAGTSGGLQDSLGAPSVIRNSATDYEMWYTQAKTDVTGAYLETILADLAGFGVNELMNILNATTSTIGYATSTDGTTWAVVDSEVLAGIGGGVWDSVSAPSVLKNGGSYEMWFTQATTDLVTADMQTLIDEIQALEPAVSNVWASVRDGDILQFLLDFQDLIDNNTNTDNIKTLLANTNTVIAYATSGDGIAWTVQDPQALVGVNSSQWASVSNPSVYFDGSAYEIWFTQGIDTLSSQNLLDSLQGDILPLGYAYFAGVDISLVSGWNFIGMPLTPSSTAIGDVLADIIGDVQTVWAYDAATTTWSYYTTIVGPPQGDLTDMTVGEGYWIEMTNPTTLTVSGAEPAYPYDIDLVIGWNLISIPETPSPSTIADVLSGIISNVQTVWAYDAATLTWSYYTTIVGPPQGDLTNMTEGKAYWIEMTGADTLTIN